MTTYLWRIHCFGGSFAKHFIKLSLHVKEKEWEFCIINSINWNRIMLCSKWAYHSLHREREREREREMCITITIFLSICETCVDEDGEIWSMLVIFSSLTKLSSPVNARTHLKPLNFFFLEAKKSKKNSYFQNIIYHIWLPPNMRSRNSGLCLEEAINSMKQLI